MKNHAQKLIEATQQHTLRPQKGDRARVIAEAYQYLIDNLIMQDTWFVEEQDLKEIIKQLKEIENE